MISSSNFTRIIERQKESGLSVKAFCSNEGLTPSTFYYWQRKIRNEAGVNRFIPLVVKSHLSRVNTISPEEAVQQPHGDDAVFEIIYRNGSKLRIKHDLDLDRLRALLSVLD